MAEDETIELAMLYPYAHKGQDMIAIVSPFRQDAAKPELVGRRVRIEDRQYKVLSIGRVTQGPIIKARSSASSSSPPEPQVHLAR